MNDKKFDEIIEALDELDKSFKKVTGTMQNGPASFYFEKMKEYYKGCMKAAKFKKGSRVKLKEDETEAWHHCQHFMKKGAKATVKEIDYRDGKYLYYIVFDKETWIKDWGDNKGEVPVENKHIFSFWQKDLEKA